MDNSEQAGNEEGSGGRDESQESRDTVSQEDRLGSS